MEENELYDRIGETDLNPTYKDGQPYMHTDINQMLGILKTAINENYYDIQRLLNGVKTVGNANKLDEATLSRYIDEELQSDDNKIPSSQQAKAYMDALFAGYSAPVRGVDYWTEADQQQIVSDTASNVIEEITPDLEEALNAKANINDVPTKVSDLTNDEEFITKDVDNLTNYYKKEVVNKKPYYFDSIADMKAYDLKVGDCAITLGYYEPNDGGAGEYKIVNDNTLTDDGGSVHKLSNNLFAKLQYINSINYNQFGAKGNGITNDFQYLKKAHDYANLYNLNVEGVTKSTYYIGEINEPILVKTNTDLKNSHFIIDDENIDFSKREISIYNICPSENDIVIPVNTVSSLDKFQKEITELQGYGDKLVYVVNSNKQVFIRRGINAGSSNLQDIFRINNEGQVLDDIIWDFEQITSLVLKHIDKEFIYFKNGIFTTKVNVIDSYSYYQRNIMCTRSNVNISGVKHYITGEDNTLISSPYQGFIYTFFATNVNIKDCTLSGHKIYVDAATTAKKGSYDLQNRCSIDIFMENINQINSISDNTIWGVHTSNFCKDLYFENCIISRVDVHRGIYNINIKNCKIGWQEIKLVGAGTAIIENTEVFEAEKFVELRSDYGATWNGDIKIKNCVLHAINNENRKKIIESYHKFDWDFGYKCYIPNIDIDDFIYDNNNLNSSEINKRCEVLSTRDYSNFENSIDYSKTYEENAENEIYPQIMAKYIKLNNLKTTKDDNYYVIINENDIENFYCENLGKTLNKSDLNNSFAVNTDFIFNFEMYLNNVKFRDMTNLSYDAARCSLWLKTGFRGVDFSNTHRTIGKIVIENQEDLYLGISGRALYLKVLNSSIKLIRIGYSGVYGFFDLENCRIKFMYSDTPSSDNPCFYVTGYAYFLNKCIFDLQDGLTLSDISGIEDPFVRFSLSTTDWLRIGGVWRNNTFWSSINSQLEDISKFREIKDRYGCSNDVLYTNENIKYIPRRIGPTANRPIQNKIVGYVIPTGFTYYDTTLNKPVFWNGTGWVDYSGTTV
ncbi:MAG: hypothetical protein II625_09785 [Bacilli bacterium]|nr:hypothetical protein [Bacilli bacterium]